VQPVAQFGLTAAAVASDASLTTLAWAWAAPIGLTMVGALVATLRLLPAGSAGAGEPVNRREFWDYAVPRGIAGSLQMALERVGVLLVGAFASAAIAGQWAAITRLVGLAQRVFHAIGQALNPRISALAAAKDWASVSSAVDRLTQWTMLILTPALLALACFPGAALGLFGDDFESGATALRIAALVVLGASLLAHADNVLLMSGESRLAMRNTAAALIVAVIGYLVLVPQWDDVGAALAPSPTVRPPKRHRNRGRRTLLWAAALDRPRDARRHVGRGDRRWTDRPGALRTGLARSTPQRPNRVGAALTATQVATCRRHRACRPLRPP